jgi:hypothetical protein
MREAKISYTDGNEKIAELTAIDPFKSSPYAFMPRWHLGDKFNHIVWAQIDSEVNPQNASSLLMQINQK